MDKILLDFEFVMSCIGKNELIDELVKKYPESLLNVNMIDLDSRNT